MNEFNTCDIIDAPTHPVKKKKKTLKNFLVKFNKGDMQRPKSDFFVLEGLEY